MPEPSGLASALLAIAMIAAFTLAAGGFAIYRRGERQKGVLMLAAAMVTVINVLIWTV